MSVLSVHIQILRPGPDTLCVPVQMYVPELDRIVLRAGTSQRPFASTSTCRKAVFTTRVLGLVHELCMKQIHVTKRDLFYTDVKLFEVCPLFLSVN